ncbi:MAG: alcohol dehydrogenase catalytic domain-containing protein, partial [Rhodospirillales bacterium]|nr:alcohol dehydrogenase catalytic domain-containing protein [Rhodospirillales bacterium]
MAHSDPPRFTRAAVLVETGRPLEIMELRLPDLKPGQVMVEMEYAGVCHTQLHEIRGRRGVDRFLPHTLGHEGSGTVLACGEGVHKVKPGDRAVLTWIKGEGADVPSSTYQGESVTVNSGAISTFMTVTVTCENRLVPVTHDKLPTRDAALLGCAVPTGAGVIENTADVAPGAAVAIFGCGGIGMSAILAAAMRKAAVVIAIDVVADKLAAAAAAGATHAINAAGEDPVARIMEITEGRGVDIALEAIGRPDTM